MDVSALPFAASSRRGRVKQRYREEWRLIPIGLRGKVLRVLVVYLRTKTRGGQNDYST
jgi:hypothetical protein